MAVSSAVATYLDLLALAQDPTFAWGPPELRAAFQWGHTLQKLANDAKGAAALLQSLQALRPRLPAGLQAALPNVARSPLRLLLERLLCRPARSLRASHTWLEAVLAGYMAAVVLPLPPPQQAAAEQELLAAMANVQAAAAAQTLLANAARQAAAAAASQLRYSDQGGGSSGLDSLGIIDSLPPSAAERPGLLAEALECLTGPTCLEAAAAAQLLVQRAEQLAAEQQPQQREGQQQPALAGLLPSPPSKLSVELLCLAVLLPAWGATLRRLASLPADQQPPCLSSSCSAGSSSAGVVRSLVAAHAAVQQEAVRQLCATCISQPEAVLAQHPGLLAEVCRCSFRFTASLAPLLAGQLVAAAEDTRAAAEMARWRAAHAVKHADHVSDYLLQKFAAAAAAAAATSKQEVAAALQQAQHGPEAVAADEGAQAAAVVAVAAAEAAAERPPSPSLVAGVGRVAAADLGFGDLDMAELDDDDW